MFKFLKEKIGSWIKKSMDSLELSKPEESKKSGKGEKSQKEVKKDKKARKKEKKKITEQEKLEQEEQDAEVQKEIKAVEEEEKEKHPEEEREKEEILEEKKEQEQEEETEEELEEELSEEKEEEEVKEERKEEQEKPEGKKGFFSRLKEAFIYRLNQEEFEGFFEGLEMLLLENNVALEVVEKIKSKLEGELVGKEIKKDEIEKQIKLSLKKALEEIIIEPDDILDTIKAVKEQGKGPFKIIFFGINGAGKTTTIAKFANLLKKNNLSCILAAADTFRAASIEQLQIHADKLRVKMIKQNYGSDPSAVAFDAIAYAKAHKIDVVLIDTAGRMHTKEDLLREMEKICRVANPDMKIFVAEAISGNDATEQAKAFNDMINIDGSILSKSDVDEKGGTIISISYITHKPILYLGTGQSYDDLKLFDKAEFISHLGLE